MQSEIIQGRGPVWLDCRSFSDAVWTEFESSQGDVVLAKITAAGGDYRREKIEVVPAAHSVLAGLLIDQNAATGVAGLFAAGENVTGIHGAGRLSGNGLTACVVMGRIAGKNASRDAHQTGGQVTASSADCLPPSQNLPTERLDTAMRAALIATMRDAAGKGLGIIRNRSGIAGAELVFADIVKKFAPPYPLHPADQDILQMGILGQLMCVAAAQRPESRGVQWRDDATTLDKNWKKWQIVTQSADGGYSWRERVIG